MTEVAEEEFFDPEENEEEEFKNGPYSVLYEAVQTNTQIMASLRNGRKVIGKVKAFDRHCNLIMENVKELWSETPKTGKGKKKANPVLKERFIPKLFVRGDSVILVLKSTK